MAQRTTVRGRFMATDRLNTVGLTERDLSALLDKLEASDRDAASRSKRTFARWPFRRATVEVTLTHPGGSAATLKLACRDLSRGGCALLHNAFVHPGTACVVRLPREDGGIVEMRAVVKRCTHRVATLHELGLGFAGEIDLKDFVRGEGGRACHSLERVDAANLAGKMLLAEGSDIDARIIEHFLRATKVQVARVPTLAALMETAGREHDVIVVEWRLGKDRGADGVKQIRDAGISTPIVLLTPDPGDVAEGVRQLGGVTLLTKPLSEEAILRTLAEVLLVPPGGPEAAGAAGGENPLRDAYVRELPALVSAIDAAMKGPDVDALREAALQIKGTAPTVGLENLGRIAADAVETLGAQTTSRMEIHTACTRLASAAKRTIEAAEARGGGKA